MKKMLSILFAGVLFLPVVLQAGKATIKNTIKAPITAVGYGAGCMKVLKGRTMACEEHTIGPGKEKKVGERGGIKVWGPGGSEYVIKSRKGKIDRKLGGGTFKFPDQFTQEVPNLLAEKKRILKRPEMQKWLKNNKVYAVVFSADKDGKLAVFLEKPIRMDDYLRIGIGAKGKPVYSVGQAPEKKADKK